MIPHGQLFASVCSIARRPAGKSTSWDGEVHMKDVEGGNNLDNLDALFFASPSAFSRDRLSSVYGTKRLTLRIRFRPAREQAGGRLHTKDIKGGSILDDPIVSFSMCWFA